MRVLEPFGFGPKDLEQIKVEGITPGMEVTPFRLARDVWSWYGISPTKQKLLLAVGRCVVARKRDEISRALGWSPPQPPEGGRQAATRPSD
jgi:hypothetical protein